MSILSAKGRNFRRSGASSEVFLTDTTRWSRAAWVATALLGVSVWGQLCGPTLMSPKIPWLIFLSVVPVFMLGYALQAKSPAAALLLFPIACLPALASMPEEARVSLASPLVASRVVLTVALYLAVAGAWLSGTQPAPDEDGKLGRPKARATHPYRWLVYSRAAVLAILLIVPVYAIYFDGPIVSTIAANHPGGERVAQTFIAMVAFFVWTVVAYTQFLVPLLNLEYDRRKIRRQALESVRQASWRRSLKRLGIEAGAVILVLLLLVTV